MITINTLENNILINSKCTATVKVNRIMFDSLYSLLEFPDETIEDWELMNDSEQKKVYNMLKKKILKLKIVS